VVRELDMLNQYLMLHSYHSSSNSLWCSRVCYLGNPFSAA